MASSKDRMMKFPYTVTAKIYNFPYKHYYKYAWLPRYWVAGMVATLPLMMYFNNIVNSPENVETWREIRKKQLEMHH